MRLDGWLIDGAARTAKRGDEVQQLSPRAIRLLSALSGGEVVGRAELLDRVWPNVFVSDQSLTQVVSELRRTLQNKRLIATIPRGGYRLTVPVVALGAVGRSSLPAGAPDGALDAYALCIEAMECFSRACDGAQRTACELAAQAVATDPNNADARALYAAFLLKRHMIWSDGLQLAELALEQVDAALSLDPGNALAHFIGASTSMMTGLHGYSAKNLEKAVALAPNDASLHSDASILLLWMGRRRASSMVSLKASRLEPARFGDEMNAARLLMHSDPAWARTCAERALSKVRQELQIDPGSIPALYALGPLLAQLGEVNAARAALEGATERDTPLEYFRATGFALLGDASAALERLEFIAMHGWRMGKLLDQDECFRPIKDDRRFRRFRGELLAA